MLLLIASVNVANLLLSRAAAREREVALRQALGASRARIMRQLLTESLLLALAGGGTGLAAAYALVRWAAARLPDALRAQGGIALSWPAVGFALAISMGAGILFGLAPALEGRRSDLNRSLKSGEARTAGVAGARLRSIFIAVQVGLSLVLLVGACLLTQSLWKLIRTPLGFEPEHLLVFKIELPWEGKAAPIDAFFNETQRHVESLPGVAAAGQITALPTVDWHSRSSYDVDWKPRTPHQDAVSAENRNIEGNYLEAMRIPLLAGRELRADDGFAVLVNQEFVRRYSPEASPVGRYLLNQYSIGSSGAKQPGIQIVGVVGNVRGTAGPIAGEVQPEVYYPAAGVNVRWFVVRSLATPEQLIAAVRNAVHEVDPQQSVGNVQTMGRAA